MTAPPNPDHRSQRGRHEDELRPIAAVLTDYMADASASDVESEIRSPRIRSHIRLDSIWSTGAKPLPGEQLQLRVLDAE
jgi:hypothetical protein